MASHLTVTTTTAGVSSSKGFNAPAGAAGDEGATDVFAALLGTAAPQGAGDTAKTSAGSMDLNLGNLVQMSLGFGDGESAEDSEEPEAVAVAIDAVLPIQTAVETVPVLTDIATTLNDLMAKLDAGQKLDPEALQHLDAALTDLADALDIDLSALPSLDELTALVTDIQPDDMSFAARLTAAFGPVAETLFSGTAAPEADAGAELSTLVKSIGEKLAALLTALNSGAIEPDQLAQLELAAEADPALNAALAKLKQPVVTVETGNAAPALATPELKLTEPALTGKADSADTAAPAETEAVGEKTETAEAPAPVQSSASDSDEPSDRNNDTPDKKPVDARPAPVAAPVDKQPEPQNAQQPVPAARVDIVAAPRVVQAGYQTSQQQLNLPQLAFELVRQVGDGNTRFQIRLDPAELGKIDVRLEIDKSGQVNARLTVEKAETLDLMQRDQKGLERALQQAGLDGAKTNLEFSLKQNPFAGQQNQNGGNGRNGLFGDQVSAEIDDTPPPTVNLYRGSLSASGVNIIA